MRLKTQFVLITVIFGALLVAVSVLAVIEGQRVNQANQEEQLAGDIARGADELGYLSNDYVVYRGSQQLDRWQTRFASFSEQISNLRTNGPQEGLLANNIRADSERMNEVFNGIISAVASFQGAPLDPGVLQASWSQMAVPSQSLASDATRLSQMAASVADGTLATRNAITYALIGLFVLFIKKSAGYPSAC